MSALFTSKKRLRIKVGGIVQGVGFRPFIYQKARSLGLNGFVLNGGDGISIEIEGEAVQLEAFLGQLTHTLPPLARIDSLDTVEIDVTNSSEFIIKASHHGGAATTMVPSDIALCDACREEMQDPGNRRYQYPFINCTNCGPRYTIIKDLPYDRVQTSMAAFKMCKDCEQEYKDPFNRRYHAQPISCHECGPRLFLSDLEGNATAWDTDALEKICALIKAGKTVAVKGMGGFHLICDAGNEEAVIRLRANKHRSTKPFAVMFPSIKSIEKSCHLNAADIDLLLSKEHPIVIVKKAARQEVAPSVAPGIDKVGVFLPYTPLHRLLLEKLNFPIIATSANLGEEPIIIDETTLLQKLSHTVSAVLSYDREIVNACDDSVVMTAGDTRLLLRSARGFAPKSLPLKHPAAIKILALGANQKSTLALAFDNHCVLSPHIGDLGSIEAFGYFERTLETFKRFYDFEPELIVCDKHPEYETSKWAKTQVKQNSSIGYLQVQHHYAHALACMAEYGLDEKVLAFCFDGTGYGDDGSLWGGEVFVADPLEYERIMHLRSFRLIGADKAVKEPRRVALSLLFECFRLDEVARMDIPTVKSFTHEELQVMHTMWKKGINAPWCSSIGRLFDAVASLSGITQILGYEGESGLMLETYAEGFEADEVFTLNPGEHEIDYRPMLREILASSNPAEIASKFIASLSALIVNIAQAYPHLPVVLCGGVFQNRLLVMRVNEALKCAGLRCYIQQETPVNDGGIALGQLYHALHVSRKK